MSCWGAQRGDPKKPCGFCMALPCITAGGCLKRRGAVNLTLSVAGLPGRQSCCVPLGKDHQVGDKLGLSGFQNSGGNSPQDAVIKGQALILTGTILRYSRLINKQHYNLQRAQPKLLAMSMSHPTSPQWSFHTLKVLERRRSKEGGL